MMENPYWLVIASPEPTYLASIAASAAFFAVLFVAVDRAVSSDASGGAFKALSSPRAGTASGKSASARSGLTAATTACSMLHAAVTSAVAVRVVMLLLAGDPGGLAANMWHWALVCSQGYFIADALLYGTRRETWVLVHHAWMIVAHHPIGELRRGCILMGCGDCNRAVWLSATGYWAEISTLFLNIRWIQHRWLRKHSILYTINSMCLLVSYPVSRVVAAAAILMGSLWPHWAEYNKEGLGNLVVFTTVTYIAMALMSSYYFYTLVSKGLARALVFAPEASKEQ